ncbi:MAG: ribosome biogenesis GTPase YlqF [Bacilli bacterium]|nr:ribosome biogenesis GTPase YlqF [Bacilli bacterium]
MNNQDNEKVFQKSQINWYPGHMAKAKRLINENINLIDIVYEVVDARIPMSSKIKDIDNFIKNKPKILIMNKIDLCDLKETNKWKKYYEKKGYKVVLTSLEKNFNEKELINLTEEILKPLNDKIHEKEMKKRKSRVLVVGVPNAGKSTLINRLAGKKVASIGNKPGVTKGLSWIRVNDKIELLDSPGILWPKLEEKNAFNLATFTAIKEEILPKFEVAAYILTTLDKYYKEKLKERYNIDELNEDIIITMEEIGKKRGCLIKGGDIDYDKVIELIINDVKNGYIKGITFDKVEDYE